MKIIKIAVLFLLAAFIEYVFNGYTFMKLYNWFVATQFHVANIGLLAALGITLLINFLQGGKKFPEEKDMETGNFVRNVFPIVVLGIGWAIHSFM